MKTPELYVRDAQGRVQPPNADWSDVAKLDYASPKTRAYMTDMMAGWLREYGVRRLPLRRGRPRARRTSGRRRAPRSSASGPDLFMLAEWSAPDLLRPRVRRRLRLALPRRAHARPLDAARRRREIREDVGGGAARLPARLAAPALLGQPRRATGDRPLRRAGGARRGGARDDDGRRAARLQRHGDRRHGRVRRPGAHRAAADLLAGRRAAAGVPGRLPLARSRCAARTPRCAAATTAWVRTSDDERVVSFVRRGAGEERARGREPVEPSVDGHARPAGRRTASPRSRPRVPLPAAAGRRRPAAPRRDDALPAIGLDSLGLSDVQARDARS